MKHIAWDESILAELFGGYGNQKTTKTLCEKRVSIHSVTTDYTTVDCPECKQFYDETIELVKQLGL